MAFFPFPGIMGAVYMGITRKRAADRVDVPGESAALSLSQAHVLWTEVPHAFSAGKQTDRQRPSLTMKLTKNAYSALLFKLISSRSSAK